MTQKGFRSSRAPPSGFFVEMDSWKVAARQAGKDIIDLSVGASDMASPQEPLETLRQATYDPSTYSYCLKNGTLELLTAACDWYKRRYGVTLDPTKEALTLIGSQEGLAHLLLGVTEHGDTVLMCDVAYPSYWGALQVAGLKSSFLHIDEESGLPDFSKVRPDQLDRAKVVLLNYPNNPTAVTADNAFFTRAIAFCKQHNLLLVHDNPYVDQIYEGQAPSPLALPGGLDCCVELFSFAKSHHLAGFRLGYALGNADAIGALEAIKAPIDFNQYKGIQLMGVTCFQLPEDRVKADAQAWRKRAAAMVDALREEAGWSIRMPTSGMYLWSTLPEAFYTSSSSHNGYIPETLEAQCSNGHTTANGHADCEHEHQNTGKSMPGSDVTFCKELLAATGVALSPGSGFGPGGHGHVRFALVADVPRLQDAARRIGQWLKSRRVNG